jgi:BirA family biotin operon repressor/biotin-[acetyl-CoA-carboxylase] ligase
MLNRRKCGGILVETAVAATESDAVAMLRYAVIGVGINSNHERFSPELEAVATSLRMELGKLISREALLAALLRSLDEEIRGLSGASSEDVLRRFTTSSGWVRGKRVRVEEGGGYTGVTDGLDSRGFLRVVGDDGVERTVLSGGVREI